MKLIIKNNQIMFIIYTYQDFCKALDLKKSDNPEERNDAKKALGVFRQKNPERYSEYYDRKKQINEQKGATKELLKTLCLDTNEIRKLAKEKIRTPKYKYLPFYADFPLGIKADDVLDAIDVLPIHSLITKTGKLTRRDIILKRCVLEVISQGKMDEEKLRQEAVKQFNRYVNIGNISVNKPLKKADVEYYLLYDIPIVELLKLFPGEGISPLPWRMADFLNSKEITILHQTHPFIINALIKENQSGQKALKKAKKKKSMKKKKAESDGLDAVIDSL